MNPAVLVVDDEEHILQSLKRLLRRDDYEVYVANSGQSGLDILARQEIAVLICDQRMPGMTGPEVLAEAHRIRPEAVRITLTGYTDLSAAQASINQGHVSHFLLKPWDDDHLRAIVRDAVQVYQLAQDHRRLEALTRQQKAELERCNQQLEDQVRQRTAELHAQNRQLLELQRRLEQSLRDTVAVLAGVLEANNPNVSLHSKRVAEFASALATRLNLSGPDLRDVEFAARLHDIGRISKLHGQGNPYLRHAETRRESQPYRHSDSGYAILSHVGGFESVARGVRHQHECYVGGGYPDGLVANQVPVASRIIAIVNAYDEAVFSTTYPTRASREAGRKMLQDGRNGRFDPRLVDLFLEYLDRTGVETRGDTEVEVSPRQLETGMRLARGVYNTDGVLLLKPETTLTPKLIERIRLLNNIDPLLNSVYVKCAPQPEGRTEPSAPPAPRDNGLRGTAAVAGPPQTRPLERKRKRVLIVDDVKMLCNALKRELRAAGYDATATSDGHAALNLVKHEYFDVLISDLLMPGMSGVELIERLQQRVPELPCIILTGNAKMDEVVRIAKSPNVAGILVKPWDKERLIATLVSAIDRRTGNPVEEVA